MNRFCKNLTLQFIKRRWPTHQEYDCGPVSHFSRTQVALLTHVLRWMLLSFNRFSVFVLTGECRYLWTDIFFSKTKEKSPFSKKYGLDTCGRGLKFSLFSYWRHRKCRFIIIVLFIYLYIYVLLFHELAIYHRRYFITALLFPEVVFFFFFFW